jgi:hypothetical protein
LTGDEFEVRLLIFINAALRIRHLLRFFMGPVQTTAAAELAEFETLGRRLLILGRHVIAAFAFRALEHNVIAGHKSPSIF